MTKRGIQCRLWKPIIPMEENMSPNKDIEIRIMTKRDIKRCAEIAYLNWPDKRRVSRHLVHELKDHINFLVAEIDTEIVGWAGWVWSKISYDVAEFVWCNVHPDHQKKGVGKKLTLARIKAIKAHDGKLIVLTTCKPDIYRKYDFWTQGVYNLWTGKKTHMMVKEL